MSGASRSMTTRRAPPTPTVPALPGRSLRRALLLSGRSFVLVATDQVAVRSARLAAGNAPAGTTTLFTVPAGKTFIVKDIRAANTSGANTNFIITATSGTNFCWLLQGVAAVNQTYSVTPTFLVLEPGDQLLLFTSAQPMQFWISGAELLGVA